MSAPKRTVIDGVSYCIHNHAVTGANVRERANGYPACLACDRDRMRNVRAIQRANRPKPPPRHATRLWDRENLAWAAGLYEGEGCATLTHGSQSPHLAYARLALGSTDLDVMDRFLAVVGVGTLVRLGDRPNRKPMWRWTVGTYEDVQAVTAAFWPWLHERRREQLRIALTGDTRRTGRCAA